MTVVSDIPAGATPISQADLTPEELAELGPELPAGATPIDPVADLDAAELAELQVGKMFDPIAWADSNQSKAFEPATLKKLSDAHDIVTSRGLGGFVPSDIAAVQSIKEGKPVEAAVKVVKPVAETLGNIAKWFGNTIIANPANIAMGKTVELFGGNPDLTNELYKQAAKGSAETVAGVESAMFGLANTGKKLSRLTAHRGSQGGDSDEGKKQKFLDDLGIFQQTQKIGAGQGEFAQGVGTSAEEMAKLGIVLDPEVIAERASGDPFAFYAFGKGFQAITPAGRVLATIPGVAGLRAASSALASKGLRWAAKEGVDLTGKAISLSGSAVKGASKTAPITGAVIGTVKGGPLGGVAGAATGRLTARTISAAGDAIKSGGATLSEFGKGLALEAGPAGSYTQLARDIIASAPPALAATAKGAAIDFGFAAAVSETPLETEEMATFGTTFGAMHGVARTARRVVQGQTLGSRPWGITEKTKPYGNFAELDAAHARSEQTRTPAEIQRADAIRAFAAKLPGGAEVFFMPDTVAFESFLINDHARKTGTAPTGQALADIKLKAGSRGMFSEEMLDDAGNQRRVIILNEVDAAPHEAAHAIQDVIGEKANEVVDALVKKEYAGQWEAIGENYARRLGGTAGTPWRDTILQRTGWLDADIYLARELAAENFDIGFKNKGGDFGRGNTLPEKLARIAVKTAVLFGGDPYVGTQTQGLRIQPKAGVIKSVAKQAELAKGTPPVIPTAPAAPLVAPRTPAAAPSKPVVTPATSAVTGVSADAKAAQAWAAGKNDPRLVNIVNSIVANQVKSAPGEAAPVRLKYLSVVGEEGSTRTPRRSEQEAAYLAEALGAMPAETRQLVEKTHAHVRFEPVKKGAEYQSIGYSLEKLVENAQRTAKWLAGNEQARALSPYEIDTTTGSFTPDAWKQLVSDIETYTVNQQAGGTGAGKALAQPANAAKLGISVPPVQAAKFSPLEQPRADFINTLMGFKLPETVRVSRAGGTPGNIVGQDISRANEQPFIQPRVSEPATPRAGGKEFPGFPGRTIQEVNPLRRQLESAGFPVNELTEVVERVNLKSLESATAAPESSFRPGVTDTIRAGFLPPAEKPKWLVKGQKGGLKTQAEFEGTDMGEARRKAESQGYRVSSVERTNPIELRTQFLPAEAEAKLVDELDPAGFTKWAKEQPGGLTGTAHRVGREATSQEFVDSLNTTAEKYRAQAKKALESKDFDVIMPIVMKGQFFREAWEAATGSGGSGELLKKQDASYAPPFPVSENKAGSPSGETVKSQLSPADEPRTGLEFKKFFSDVTKGNFGKSDKPFEPVLDLSDAREAIEARSEHTGNFDDHIAKSIPTFYEAQIRKAKAIAEVFGDKQTRLLDVAASEGSFGKSVSDLTGGVVETVSLDPNPDMAKFFREKSNAPKATYLEEAFLNGFEDAGKKYPAHNPEKPYDVITEAMGFQFIDKNRGAQLDEVKRLLAPDGVFLMEEKVRNPDWARNEAQKDTDYKSKYFSTDDLAKKDARVGFAQSKDETKSVGMVDNMVEQSALESDLKNRFKHVVQYWDSGNFKGYVAGDNAAKVDATVAAMGDLNSDFSTVRTPRTVQDAGAVEQQFEMGQRGQFSPKNPYEKYNREYDAAVAKRKPGLTGWILPNNKFVPLSRELGVHEDYLAGESESLNKEFGTKFGADVPVNDRQDALNAGFIRMRKYGGTLHVESGQAGWTKAARDKVFETIADNIDNIDQIQVSVLDKNGIVKRQGSERLMDYETDAEKLNNIPLISEGRTQFLPSSAPRGIKAAAVQDDVGKIFEGSYHGTAIDKAQIGKAKPIPGYFDPSWDVPFKVGFVTNEGEFLTRNEAFDRAKELKQVPEGVRKEDLIEPQDGPHTRDFKNMGVLGEGRSAFLPAESSNLPGMEEVAGREFNRAAINQMNRAELRKHFPEALVPRSADEKINSNIVGSPLAKQEGGRPAAVEAFANTLVDFYNEIKDQPEAKAGESWYSDFTPRLKKEFGKDAPMMAELLAATSPQTNPQVNFGYAFDALEGFKSGKYDKQVAKFSEGLERLADGSLAKIYDRDARVGKVNNPPENASDATYLAHWIDKHDLVPRGSSGKLFGTHSIRVIQVLSRKWLEMNAGPKTSNFVQNLLGTGSEATIDLWADRTMRRIGYSGYADRWRILPENGTGVSNEDFAFSQEAFASAAKKIGIKPSALQGALWFGEKKYWSDKGWGRLDLGDYRDELAKVSLLRAGVKQREEATRLGKQAGSAEQEALDLGLTIEPRQAKFKR